MFGRVPGTAGTIASVACGVCAGLLLGLCLTRIAVPDGPGDARLVSDVDGAMREICVHYAREFHAECVEVFSDLFRGLQPGARVWVVTASKEEFVFLGEELKKGGVPRHISLASAVTGFPITPWAKDRFGTLARGRRAVLAVPPARSATPGPRANDELVPERLAEILDDVECMPLPFFFDGGDLLADDENVFVAPNFLARNQPYDVDARPALLRQIERVLGRHVVVVGDSIGDVPDHHIGMYLTPLGDGAVAVADPDLGRMILSADLARYDVELEGDDARYAAFRNVIRVVEQQGLRVVRVPMVLTGTPRVYVTYNNALLEKNRGSKRILMPVYGIPALDRAARDVFEKEGWSVHPVRVAKVFRHTGSLRCLVGIIRRG